MMKSTITPESEIETARNVWSTQRNIMFQYMPAYDALVKLGMVNLTNDEKRAYMKEATIIARTMKPSMFENIDRLEWIKNYSKKLVISDYFTNEKK